MIGIVIALAVAAAPQSATTTSQGNGHHASDDRRPESHRTAKAKPGADGKEAEGARPSPGHPAEHREPNGALMPGAPGTNNPTIPDTSSGG